VLDVGDVPYLLSAALGKLIKLNKKVVGRGGKLRAFFRSEKGSRPLFPSAPYLAA
jgi:hypothetical protein